MAVSLMPVQRASRSAVPRQNVTSGGEIIDALRADDQPLFDRRRIVGGVGGSTFRQILFFAQGHVGNRSWPDTNVPQANKLPGELAQSIRGISVSILDDPTRAQYFDFGRAIGVLYKARNRRFLLRSSALGGGGGFSGIGQGAAEPLLIQNGPPSINDYYRLWSSIPLQANDNFNFALEWPADEPFQLDEEEAVTFEIRLYGGKAGLVDRN